MAYDFSIIFALASFQQSDKSAFYSLWVNINITRFGEITSIQYAVIHTFLRTFSFFLFFFLRHLHITLCHCSSKERSHPQNKTKLPFISIKISKPMQETTNSNSKPIPLTTPSP